MENKANFLGYIDTIIVGGGQAGLSVGRYLKEAKRPFLILEKSQKIGSTWESRYDSLKLDSFAKYSFLEDFPFLGDQMRQVGKDEVATYLENFAKHFDITSQFSTEVLNIRREEKKFIVTTNKGTYHAKFVVLATGPFHKPFIPENAKDLPKNIYQIHSKDYKNVQQLKDGPILIVGGGNSGAEIAEEIIEHGREVFFSFKGKFKSVKSSHLSQWLAYRLGLAHVPKDSLLGKLIIWYTKGKPVGVDIKSLLKNPLLTKVGAFIGVKDGQIICEKADLKNISNIIWATGYKSDFSIISIPNFDSSTQKRGVTNIPNLFVLNIRWQYSKSSSHLAGVSRDAKHIASYIYCDILRK